MYGPTGKDLLGCFLILILLGGCMGLAAEHGCAFVRRHVGVEFR